jgi:hypothetical protein
MIPKHQNNYKLVNGTSLRGYVKCDYKTLIETFGEPDHECDGYKIDRQWILKFGDGTVATIYNYKNGKNYLGPQQGLEPEDIKEWHVGGKAKMAVTLVEMSIDAKELLLLK